MIFIEKKKIFEKVKNFFFCCLGKNLYDDMNEQKLNFINDEGESSYASKCLQDYDFNYLSRQEKIMGDQDMLFNLINTYNKKSKNSGMLFCSFFFSFTCLAKQCSKIEMLFFLIKASLKAHMI